MKDNYDLSNDFVDFIVDKISNKVIKENSTDRARLFTLIVYQDTTSYNYEEVLDYFRSLKYCAFIYHDKDLKTDLSGELEELKKPHYHIVVKYDNATTPQAISKKCGVPTNYIQSIRSERQMIRYLIHKDHPDKYQYEYNDIYFTPSYEKVIKSSFDDLKTEEEQLLLIKDFIDNLKDTPDYTMRLFKLIMYVNTNNYNRIYKRYEKEFNLMLNYID